MWRFFSEGTTSFPLKSASPCFSWFSMQNVKKQSPQTRANPIIKHSFYHVTPSMHVVEQISENKLQCLLHETFFVSVPMGKNLNKSHFYSLNMECYQFTFHQNSSSSVLLSCIFSFIVGQGASWEILLISYEVTVDANVNLHIIAGFVAFDYFSLKMLIYALFFAVCFKWGE